jgi:hypothetical protein
MVLMAVAKFEFTFWMPIFAKIAVRAAKKADRKANKIHVWVLFMEVNVRFMKDLYTPHIDPAQRNASDQRQLGRVSGRGGEIVVYDRFAQRAV